MSKATKGTSTLFPQVSRGESNDAAKGLLDDAGDSSGDEAAYAPRGDYAPPRPVTTQPSGELPVNQNCIVAGEEVSFVEISPDRPRLRGCSRQIRRQSIRLATPAVYVWCFVYAVYG